jgi:small GTP-binding protein
MAEKRIVMGILAHVDSGKTTLSEAILYSCGEIRKLGRVDHKNSFLDTDEIERERGITIFSKQAVFTNNLSKVTLLDTPGHADFGAEAERTIKVLDYAILVVSAPGGVQSHTKTLWKLLETYSIPTFIFVNKMDLYHGTKEELLDELKAEFSDGCICFDGDFDKDDLEHMALCDDEVMDSFLNGNVDDISIAKAIRRRNIFPVYFGSALKNEGVSTLLEGFDKYTLPAQQKNDFGARVFKISEDSRGIRLTHIKITGGKLSVKDELTGTDAGGGKWSEKVNEIRIYSGEKYDAVSCANQGTVCCVSGLSHTYAGMGLGLEEDLPLEILEPVFSYNVIIEDGTNHLAVLDAFKKLSQEETKLDVRWNTNLRKITVQLMGEIQTEVIKRIMQSRFGIKLDFEEGGIVYKETIEDTVEGVGHYEPLRHYAEVHLILKPGKRGSGITFSSKCREDELELNWQRLILTHLAEKTHIGVLTGSPITDMEIVLASGRAHLKHTDGGDFRQATYRAVRHGLRHAKSVLLEPWYNFVIEVPKENAGRVLNDISQMGAIFAEPELDNETCRVKGSAPVEKIQSYYSQIVAFTHGLGKITCSLKGYEPCKDSKEIIDKIAYNCDADVENTADSVFCSHGAAFNVNWQEVTSYMHLESALKEKEDTIQDTVYSAKNFDASKISDDELNRIFEMTFGKPKEKQDTVKNRTGQKPYKSKEKPVGLKEEYILVDGYNIIFAWEDLRKKAEESIDLARNTLITKLINYKAVKGCRLAVVFDAYKVKGNLGEIENTNGIDVVYTKEAETADSYIERLSHTLSSMYLVRVATSDSLEQMIIVGAGALRVSAKQFEKEVTDVENAIQNFLNNQ